jgi:hypothetical protein
VPDVLDIAIDAPNARAIGDDYAAVEVIQEVIEAAQV